MEETMKDYSEFQKLLQKGIGERSQTQFAKETGLSRVQINKMLNNKTIQRPKKETLKVLADHMNTVSYNDLLDACGYDVMTIKKEEGLFTEEVLNKLNANRGHLYKNLEEYVNETLKDTSVKISPVHIYEKEEAVDQCSGFDAEKYILVRLRWKYDLYEAVTYLVIGYVQTTGNNLVPVGVRLAKQEDKKWFAGKTITGLDLVDEYGTFKSAMSKVQRDPFKFHPVRGRMTAEERLLNTIFGLRNEEDEGEGAETYPVVYTGCGFEYTKTPESFKDFIVKYRRYFCTSRLSSELYRKLITTPNDKIDELFKGYNEVMQQDNYGGTVEAVCKVLSGLTGEEFEILYQGQNDQVEPTCIMHVQDSDEILFDQKVEIGTYFVARDLGIDTFGQIYRTKYVKKLTGQVYSVQDYHIEF